MFRSPPTAQEWADAKATIDQFLDERLTDPDEAVVDVSRDADIDGRWYVRMAGEARDFTTVWLTLGQRTLRHETYVLPHPEENGDEVRERLLRYNHDLAGARFSIGDENSLFLVGEVALHQLDDIELDQLLGRVYATIERYFESLVKLAFASHFSRTDPAEAIDNGRT